MSTTTVSGVSPGAASTGTDDTEATTSPTLEPPAAPDSTTAATSEPTTTTDSPVAATTSRPIATTTTAPTTTTHSPTTTTEASEPTTTTLPRRLDTGDVTGFAIISANLGGRSLLVALADTTPLRTRGLMGVKTLGELDGMVFTWEEPRKVSFWMKDTEIPLDIGYFDEQGVLFTVLSMVPCTADPCPTYPSEMPVLHALEALPGFFDDIPPGVSLTLGEALTTP